MRIRGFPLVRSSSVSEESGDFLLRLRDEALAIRLSVLSATCLRVRFSPRADADYATETSLAVIDRDFGPVDVRVAESTSQRLIVDTGVMRFEVDLQPYGLRVYRDAQLICADQPGRNLVYRPGEHGIANIKARPENAIYCGFGEKAGARLLKNGSSMTNFNFDNFIYARAPIPPGSEGGAAQSGGAALRVDPVADRDQSLRRRRLCRAAVLLRAVLRQSFAILLQSRRRRIRRHARQVRLRRAVR